MAHNFTFLQQGKFEQVLSATLKDTGTWKWVDDKHTIMHFTVTPGGANIINEYWIKFALVEASTLEFYYSKNDTDFTGKRKYTDKKN